MRRWQHPLVTRTESTRGNQPAPSYKERWAEAGGYSRGLRTAFRYVLHQKMREGCTREEAEAWLQGAISTDGFEDRRQYELRRKLAVSVEYQKTLVTE